MRVSVLGLGYVGSVSCGCLAGDGHEVVGVDVNPAKVEMINAGRSPVVEEGIDGLISSAVLGKRLRATSSVREAILSTELSLVSVGTPGRPNGSVDLAAVERVSDEVGAAMALKKERHLVVMRSTVPPGTVRSVVIPRIGKASGKRVGADFGVCFNPEFLREGKSVWDYHHPPYTLVGSDDPGDADRVKALYGKVEGEFHVTSLETAEMVKYVCNTYHALKVTFANEIGILSRSLGVDGRAVMDLFCRDTKLNISPAYLKPGFAFGGSCLPKDVRALVHQAAGKDVAVPLLAGILQSNAAQIERAVARVLAMGKRKVALLGLSFKAGTDDLRESPLVALAERLLGKGYQIRVYDANVELARLTGANKQYIEREIPHIASLLVPELKEAVEFGEILIIGNGAATFQALAPMVRRDHMILDLAGMPELAAAAGSSYQGIAW